jgi:preprotein translocase subunit SecG
MLTLANILYVLVSVAMIVMILLQRGAGAAAGSGFRLRCVGYRIWCAWCSELPVQVDGRFATLFFVISLGMAVYASRGGKSAADDLGVMGAVPVAAPAPVVESDLPCFSTRCCC